MARKPMKILIKTLMALMGAVIFISAAMAGDARKEYLVKAAFLYNFIKFVSFEKNVDASRITICAFGDPDYLKDIKSIEGKKAHERTIRVLEADSPDKASECNVVFISRYDAHDFTALISGAVDNGSLTVSDVDGFAEKGGVIELFTTEDNKIRFKINLRSAEKSGLKISSELLKLAVIIGKED